MFVIAGASLALMFLFLGLFVGTKQMILFTLGITAMTICYHFAVRMASGTVVDYRFHNEMDSNKPWFKVQGFEKGLYKFLRVKKWKDFLPTYRAEYFSMKDHSIEEILGAGCQAEIVHELCMVASLLSMTFATPFGSFGVFCATAIIGALIDLSFVIIQRYNRPRLKRAAGLKNRWDNKEVQ